MLSRLFLFTKPAIPGRVKTRLIGELEASQAAELHRAFVGDLVSRLRSASTFSLEVSWALEVDEVPPKWPETRDLPWRRQASGGLGDRLFASLHRGAAAGAFVAAVGSDHPELTVETMESAFERLREGADMALGPAEDGGYYLIALRPSAVNPRLFEAIDWSTDAVFAQTLERARELNLKVAELPIGHDVDFADDLRALARRLSEAGGMDCPRSREVLTRFGFLPPTGKE